ncbi:MAG: hypothetical protein ACJ788_24405 [Ktedonobacteraceae bacterium]
MRGKSTTLYAEPVEREIHHVLLRNATAEDEQHAKRLYPGGTLIASTLIYRIVDARRDDLNRLLLIGTLER